MQGAMFICENDEMHVNALTLGDRTRCSEGIAGYLIVLLWIRCCTSLWVGVGYRRRFATGCRLGRASSY